jgi:hypothetical protein
MSKSLQYLKVLETLKNANGPVTVSAIKAIDGIVPTRLSTYLWEIKKHTGFSVQSNRDGRTVVSYELVGTGTVSAPKVAKTKAPKAAKPAAPAVAKPAKATKAPKAKTVAVAPKVTADDIITETMKGAVMKDSMVFDALDEIQTNVQDFEDRSYAEQYVKSL